jgi:hypothetical protein
MKPPKTSRPSRSSRTLQSFRVRLEVESLEVRIVPYALSGGAWPHPEMVTISFVPDGTIVGTTNTGYAYSNLFAKMNARFGSPATWEALILRGAQSWAAQTNINFDIVSDNGTPIGQGAYQQGDPGMGDIRIGGYAYSPSYLATAYLPPALNNYSIAGDIEFNTQMTWNNGSTYDLFSVAAHEVGHALGLYHSTTNTAVMFGTYNGVKSALTSDDISGIRAIYSSGNPRAGESGSNDTVATATDVSSSIDPNALTALVQSVDITTTSDVDYYSFLAPSSSGSTLTVNVQSAGLSMLTPSVTLYASDGSTVLASTSDAGHLGGNTLSLTYSGTIASQQFYVKVAGADSTVFSTGQYAVTLNMGGGTSPTVPLPNTQTANGSPIHQGGGQPETRLLLPARLLSARFGLTLQTSRGFLNGSADAEAVSPEADKTLDQLVDQLNGQIPGMPPPHSPALLDTNPLFLSVGRDMVSIFTATPGSVPYTYPVYVARDIMSLQTLASVQAISSVFAEADQPTSVDRDAADATPVSSREWAIDQQPTTAEVFESDY